MRIALVSAKGAPGVTTLAAAMAAAADALLVEVDPSGGSVECVTGMSGEPGLVRVANGLRRAGSIEVVTGNLGEAPPGVRALLAPSAPGLAASAIGALGVRFSSALSEFDADVVLDAGRWAPWQPSADRIRGSNVVGVLCAPTVAGVEAARWTASEVSQAMPSAVSLVVVGDRPYRIGEIADAVELPVVGPIPWDPRGVRSLWASGATRGWKRSALARSARAAHRALGTLVETRSSA